MGVASATPGPGEHPERPPTHTRMCGCQKDEMLENFNTYICRSRIGEGRGMTGAGWLPADETDVGPYWKASAQCTRVPSSTSDIWASVLVSLPGSPGQ